jgi:hypothetical protein
MNDEKMQHIRQLANDRARANLCLYAAGVRNVPSDLDERIRADAQYALMREAAMRADTEYRKAVDALSHADLLQLAEFRHLTVSDPKRY